MPIVLLFKPISGNPHPIVIDGRMDDWTDIAPLFQPERPAKPFDLTSLWVTDDAQYLFLRIDLNQDILLQENNSLALYLDIDGQGETGDLAGAEIAFFFGDRRGYIQHDGESIPIEYQALDLYIAPSTMGHSFEISISWTAHPWLKKLGFGEHRLGVMLFDRREKEILCYAHYFPTREARPILPLTTLDRADPSHLRLVTHNVNKRHFHPDKRDVFTRIYQALDPDILLLEEAYEGSAEEILDYFRPALNGAPDWYAYKAGEEATVVLSPFPAIQVVPLGNSAAYLLDLRPAYEGELALVVLSMPCCRADSARQAEADQIADYVRVWKDFQLKPGTPIVLAGDANLVGPAAQLLPSWRRVIGMEAR
ncbi:MAG: endonuclease/exonuclease/phosphatase family protein [Saprospirales bacterium]|nr:endonuclease/exonuclease/phosphatase family protein [Saprospirales bacterium]